MKIKLLCLFLCVQFLSFSQISVGSNDGTESADLDKTMLDTFKTTKTIFLLSDVLEKETYEKILKDSWTVTDYEIVDFNNFKIENYLSDAYSIAQISGFDKSQQTKHAPKSTGLFTFVEFKIFDGASIAKKLAKISSKKNKPWQKSNIINEHSYQVASFYLYPNDHLIQKTMHEKTSSVVNSMYSERVFLNYSPGLLKNYFQKINNTIDKRETYAMYGNDYHPELEKLVFDKLYIPSYTSITYNDGRGNDSDQDKEVIEKLFEEYECAYEIISDEELSNRIMQNEEFHYLRYVRANGERFIQIVNSKSGEVIYRNCFKGLSHKMKSKHIADLTEKIKASGTMDPNAGEVVSTIK